MLKKIIMTVVVMLAVANIMYGTDPDIVGNVADFVAENHEISYYSLDVDGIHY